MKLNFLDKIIRSLSPEAFNKRLIAKTKSEILLNNSQRNYEAVRTLPLVKSKSGSLEVKDSVDQLRHHARNLYKNNPYTFKAVSTIANSVVGWGIEPLIKHKDAQKQKQINDLWNEWSKHCGSQNESFQYLQRQAIQSVVIDGEILFREFIEDQSLKLEMLESDMLATSVHKATPVNGAIIHNGIILKDKKILGYYIYEFDPSIKTNSPQFIKKDEIIHVFRKDRPSQNRGVSWFANVMQSLSTLNDLTYTHLMRMKLSSALTAIVTEDPSLLTNDQLKSQRENDWALEPGSVRYLTPGQSVNFPSIPNVEGFDSIAKLTIREVASGLGMTYEQLSGDLSQVNFSSGRLGNLQFQANVTDWQWNLMIPQFCEPVFAKFKKFCALKGISTEGIEVSWNPPAKSMIDPQTEISAAKDALRSGLMTLPQALREFGFDPEKHLEEIASANKKLDELGIILDSDPRKTGNQQLQNVEAFNLLTSKTAKK